MDGGEGSPLGVIGHRIALIVCERVAPELGAQRASDTGTSRSQTNSAIRRPQSRVFMDGGVGGRAGLVEGTRGRNLPLPLSL